MYSSGEILTNCRAGERVLVPGWSWAGCWGGVFSAILAVIRWQLKRQRNSGSAKKREQQKDCGFEKLLEWLRDCESKEKREEESTET